MTTAHMLLRALAALLLGASLVGCASGERRLDQPYSVVAPYAPESGVVWAVAPLRNESGVSVADELRIADELVAQIQQAHGISSVPLNRTLAAMRELGIPEVDEPDDALRLARHLGVDGIVAGSVTDWHPYEPPRLGITAALFAADGSMMVERTVVDPRALTGAATDGRIRVTSPGEPLSVAALHLDAANHDVLADVKAYARGRHDPASAMGWERYTKSMARFTEYAANRALRELLASERRRLSGAAAGAATAAR